MGVRPLGQLQATEAGKRPPLYGIFIISLEDSVARGFNATENAPVVEDIRDTLFDAMQKPPKELRIKPCRPETVAVETEELAEGLRQSFADAGVQVKVVVERAPEGFDRLIDLLDQQLGAVAPENPALTSIAGVTRDLLSAFYAAAAAFYRDKPWESLGEEQVLQIAAPEGTEPWYAVVLGKSETDIGLALFANKQELASQFSAMTGSQSPIPAGPMLTLLFGGKAFISPGDAEAIRGEGYEIAGREAYPLLIATDGKGGLGLPGREELEWFIAALGGIVTASRLLRAGESIEGAFPVQVLGQEVKVSIRTG
ncbi:MAG: hypothetical protein ACM3JD_18955 [Rudaea sp.]